MLRGVSLELSAGELLCLLGPSGCGKTTLLRLAAGIERCQQGQIALDDQVVGDGEKHLHLPPEARHVGMMFQDFALFPHLTVRQNMMFGARTEKAERSRWVEVTAARMGVDQFLDQYPGKLSGGQQQRVALIRALAPSPRALLLDEPFSGLDAAWRADVREQTQALIRDTGIAALMVTHDPEEAMFMADRIAVMNAGQIVQIGTPDELYFEPINAFVAGLFGPLNRLSATRCEAGVDTAFGRFAATNLGVDETASVVFRPDNLQAVAPNTENSCPATIVSARRLGSEVQIQLHVDATASNANESTVGSTAGSTAISTTPLRLQARWPAVKLPVEGTRLHIAIRHRDQVFVFAKQPG